MSIWSTEKSELNHQTISNKHILCPLTSPLSKGRMPSWYCRCHQLPSAGFLASCQLSGGLQPPHPVLQQDPGRSNSFEHQPVVWQRLGLATFWVVYGIITYYYGTEMKPFGKKRNIGLNLLFVPNAEHARPKHTKCCMFWLLASCEVSTNSCVWSWGSGNHELWISTGVNLFAAVSSTTWQYISLGICMDCSYILVSFVALQTPWQHHTASKALSSHSAIVLTTPPPQPSVQRRPKTYSIRMSEPRCPLLILGQTLGPSILIYFDTFGAFWSCVCPSFTVIKWKFGGPPPKKGPKHCWRPPASPSSRSIPRGPHAGSRTQLKEWVKIEGAKRWCFFWHEENSVVSWLMKLWPQCDFISPFDGSP